MISLANTAECFLIPNSKSDFSLAIFKAKRYVLLSFALISFTLTAFPQSYHRSQIPSIILNNFQKSFPEATDISWKKTADFYKVEFEIGFWNDDHTVWYNTDGKMIRHQEEIAKKDLPQSIRFTITKNYKWYWISDITKTTEQKNIYYNIELKSLTREWELTFDESGKLLQKTAD